MNMFLRFGIKNDESLLGLVLKCDVILLAAILKNLEIVA